MKEYKIRVCNKCEDEMDFYDMSPIDGCSWYCHKCDKLFNDKETNLIKVIPVKR